MDAGAQVVLWGSIGLVSISLLGSFWLVVQAVLDRKALAITGKNGPLKTLARLAIVQEGIRFAKLLLLLTLFILATVWPPGEQLLLRRGLILLVVALISAGSLHANFARRALADALRDANQRIPGGQ